MQVLDIRLISVQKASYINSVPKGLPTTYTGWRSGDSPGYCCSANIQKLMRITADQDIF